MPTKTNPRVTDDDKGNIFVTFEGHEIRGWSYANDAERRTKMLLAREYVEGWCDGREKLIFIDINAADKGTS